MDDCGYRVFGEARGLVGSLAGRIALVCGNSEFVHYDLDAALNALEAPVIFAVNDIGAYLPLIHHWVSLHADKLNHWVAARKCEASLWQDFKTHVASSSLGGANYIWPIEPCTFSLSGLFAAQIAYIMGAERIVLCGCPGDGTRRFFDRKARIDYAYGAGDSAGDRRDNQQLMNELERVPEFRRRLRSMSGRTKQILGGL